MTPAPRTKMGKEPNDRSTCLGRSRLGPEYGEFAAASYRLGLAKLASPTPNLTGGHRMNRKPFSTRSDDRATDPIFSHLLKAGETVFHNHEHRRCGNELELLRNYSATEENPWHVQLLMRK
jgi:hypothetical protein